MDYHQLTSGERVRCPHLECKDSRPLKSQLSWAVIALLCTGSRAMPQGGSLPRLQGHLTVPADDVPGLAVTLSSGVKISKSPTNTFAKMESKAGGFYPEEQDSVH